jgi:hypothetical protein
MSSADAVTLAACQSLSRPSGKAAPEAAETSARDRA